MSEPPRVIDALPTPLLRCAGGGALKQQVRLTLDAGAGIPPVVVSAGAQGVRVETPVDALGDGEHTVVVYAPEISGPADLEIDIRADGRSLATFRKAWTPPRRWTAHIVHSSHHDLGYTDLTGKVLSDHAGYLEHFIGMARDTRDWPEESQARILIEQYWSIEHFFRVASPELSDAMRKLIRSGHAELTALFGNMATELCGHESLVRMLYGPARLAREIGVDIISAEHNDIPGIVWGVSDLLVDAGVQFFSPAFPHFYGWSGAGYPSFWDEEAIFGTLGAPGAFWWKTPSGKRLLLWCNNWGCNGPRDTRLNFVADRLGDYEEKGYPFSVVRLQVTGSTRDNSPYLDFTTAIREWNEQWAFPRLVSSTNRMFYEEFARVVSDNIPEHRGDIPGQDYPAGATSTAAATTVNRSNHYALPRAEALAVLASDLSGYPYQADELRAAYGEMIMYDEHTWGHHFPCGPANLTAEMEKAVHAHRAAAFAHEVHNKAMARLADRVKLEQDGIHLVVFNPCPYTRTDMVSTPMREFDNSGSELDYVPSSDPNSSGIFRPVALSYRWHVSPEPEYVEGRFDLVDTATNESVPYELGEIESPMAPLPYAGQRIGLGKGVNRYGFFELPAGLRFDLRFLAQDVPAMGYRTYRLVPREECADHAASEGLSASDDGTIENEFYRVSVNSRGVIESIYDKRLDRELVNSGAKHPFGSIVVRDVDEEDQLSDCVEPPRARLRSNTASLTWRLRAHGHPVVEWVITLSAGIPRVEFGVGVLKDPTPLLDVAVAFPFDMPDGRFRIEEPLHVADPTAERLPGAFFNRLVCQDWIKISDGAASIVWSSLDAPVISIGRLWPHRVSPAHCPRPPSSMDQPPQDPRDLQGGALYSCISNNNMATNFSVAQSGVLYFRYVMTSAPGDLSDSEAARHGDAAMRPLCAILTKHPGDRPCPDVQALMEIDNADVRLLALKRAEDGRGRILRLWNPTAELQSAGVTIATASIQDVIVCNVVEEDSDIRVPHTDHAIQGEIAPRAVLTLRILTND